MKKPIKTITVVDARTLDGNPYEVAVAAVDQALAVTEEAVDQVDIATRMGRNAHDERNLIINGEVSATPYADTPEGKNFASAADSLSGAVKRLQALRRAVGFNPKARTPRDAK